MSSEVFILKMFEIAFGNEARPHEFRLPEDDPQYRCPFTYEETLEEIERINKVAYDAEEALGEFQELKQRHDQ